MTQMVRLNFLATKKQYYGWRGLSVRQVKFQVDVIANLDSLALHLFSMSSDNPVLIVGDIKYTIDQEDAYRILKLLEQYSGMED